MPEKILIAQTDRDSRARLSETLQTEGYFVLEAADLKKAARYLRHHPSLLLLEIEMATHELLELWMEFGKTCQDTDVPCLVFSSRHMPPEKIRELAPWAAECIFHFEDHNEVLLKVANQFTIRRLAYEFNLAQNMLLEKSRELERHLRSAAQIQKSLIPATIPKVRNLDFSWRFLPCRKVGGDLFNILQLDEDTVMAYVLDVSGHGISSAMVTVSVYQSLSHQMGQILKQPIKIPPYYRILSPAEVMEELDQEYPFERFEMFFTISYLLINPASGQVRYCNAGHPPPILVRRNGAVEILEAGGTIIGLGGKVPFEEGEVRLQQGDRLFVFTDGILEHANDGGELYGTDRLHRKLVELRDESLFGSCRKTIESLYAFRRAKPLEDDVTLLGIEFLGG